MWKLRIQEGLACVKWLVQMVSVEWHQQSLWVDGQARLPGRHETQTRDQLWWGNWHQVGSLVTLVKLVERHTTPSFTETITSWGLEQACRKVSHVHRVLVGQAQDVQAARQQPSWVAWPFSGKLYNLILMLQNIKLRFLTELEKFIARMRVVVWTLHLSCGGEKHAFV